MIQIGGVHMQVQTDYIKAANRKYPEQVVITIAKDKHGKYNPITLGWSMITSHNPPMMAISVGKTRYSLEVIRYSKEFVLSFPSSGMVKQALFYGTKSGREIDKFAQCPLNTLPAIKVDSVILEDAVANFECKLESEHISGDHVIFVGKVIESHVNEDREVERLYTLETGYRMGGVKKIV
jgi:flavin reductase (DIM6/NTAB) family NADH-FMN oxidoreductase RutF